MVEVKMVRSSFLRSSVREWYGCQTPGTGVMHVCQTLGDLCAWVCKHWNSLFFIFMNLLFLQYKFYFMVVADIILFQKYFLF
jgi:hypothetical protein